MTPYEVAARRRARLAAGRRAPAVDDPHPRARAPGAARVRLVPRRRAASARRTRCRRASTRRASSVDALWAYSRRLQAGREPWPDCLLLLGDQVYADEVSPRDARVHPRRAATSAAARRAGRRLRGVHAAVPRGVERPGHPLAALDGAEHDDLRRPRRARRLEHLRGVGAGDARQAVVGRAHHRRVHVVLALPAPRQPRPAGAGRGGAAPRSSEAARTAARGCASSRTWPTASRPRAVGRSTATSGARGSSWSTRAPRACSPTAAATWSTRRSGSGSSSTRAATSTT